jgi:hypothetical protein
MFTPRQLAHVIRGAIDLDITLSTDASTGRLPRWSREVLTAFAAVAGTAEAADLAVVCSCLPHLLLRRSASGRKPEETAPPASTSARKPGETAPPASTSGRNPPLSWERWEDNSTAGLGVDAITGGDEVETSEAFNRTHHTDLHGQNSVSVTQMEDVSQSDVQEGIGTDHGSLHPLVSHALTAITEVAHSKLDGMTAKQLHGSAVGLAAVRFPASQSFLEAHAR